MHKKCHFDSLVLFLFVFYQSFSSWLPIKFLKTLHQWGDRQPFLEAASLYGSGEIFTDLFQDFFMSVARKGKSIFWRVVLMVLKLVFVLIELWKYFLYGFCFSSIMYKCVKKKYFSLSGISALRISLHTSKMCSKSAHLLHCLQQKKISLLIFSKVF